MSTAKELRARARVSLGGSIFNRAWLFALLAAFIISMITSVAKTIIPGIGSIVVFVLNGPLCVGLAAYYVRLSKREIEPDNLSSLFEPFKTNLSDSILTGVLANIFIFLWSLLFFIPGIVKRYSYAMTYYIRIDHPEYSATQAITESRKMMNGHKFRLFCLDLSFIGWYIVGFIACCIGMLWVTPYHNAARAEFYKDLKGEDPIITEGTEKNEAAEAEDNSWGD